MIDVIAERLSRTIERKKTQAELKESYDKIEVINEKLRVLGRLTRHDVRNKMSGVSGYTYLLKKEFANHPEVIERLTKIEQAVAESVKIFDFASMYEQLGVKELFYFDVEQAVNEAVALSSGCPINVINNCQGLSVLADSFLSQLFYNFIDNTKKYGQKTTTIRVYYDREDSEGVRLIYEDDGVGILEKNKSNLFKEGFSTGGSTGFGLFLIKKMMDVYGWIIQENGDSGNGVRFVMTIPKINKNGQPNFKIQTQNSNSFLYASLDSSKEIIAK